MKFSSEFMPPLPPYPSIFNNEGRIKFSFTSEFHGRVEGTKKKKSVRLYIGRVNGIIYNYEMFKSYKEMEFNSTNSTWKN